MKNSIRLAAEPLRTSLFGAITVDHTAIGTPTDKTAHCLILQNTTNVTLYISLDKIDDHIVVLNGGQLVLDITTNKKDGSGFFVATGTQFYVRHAVAAPPTVGELFMSVIYGSHH